MNIKEFIIKGDIPTAQPKEVKQRNKPEVTFTLEYENDTDFILKRTTPRTEKMLVVLVSQAQVYIKDVKENTIEKVDIVSQIRDFKKGMDTTPAFNKLIWSPFKRDYWDTKVYVSTQFENLLNHLETYRVLANKKLNPFTDTSSVWRYENDPEGFNRQSEFLKIIHVFNPTMTATDGLYTDLANGIKNTGLDYNIINKNKDLISLIGVNTFQHVLRTTHLNTILKEYGVDLRRFLTYLIYTIKYRNGLEIQSYGGYYSNTMFVLSDYADYLRMQKEMYGKIKEKYPLYWLSEKQMMNNKYNEWKRFRNVNLSTINQDDLNKYEYEDKVFKVVIPKLNIDILDEAEQQHHCLASYIDRITKGETHVVFIRTKLCPDESLLTVEITPEGKIVQVRGFQNRYYNKLEYSFMKDWAKATGLELEVKEIV